MKRVPSDEVSRKSRASIDAPAMGGMGGRESFSTHMGSSRTAWSPRQALLLFCWRWRLAVLCWRLGFLVQAEGEGLRVGDLDQIADLDLLEVLGVARLDRLRVPLGTLDGHRLGLLVDGGDRRRDGDLATHHARRRLPWLRRG